MLDPNLPTTPDLLREPSLLGWVRALRVCPTHVMRPLGPPCLQLENGIVITQAVHNLSPHNWSAYI